MTPQLRALLATAGVIVATCVAYDAFHHGAGTAGTIMLGVIAGLLYVIRRASREMDADDE